MRPRSSGCDLTHVVFYRAETLRHIAHTLGWRCEIPAKDVALMHKPAADALRMTTALHGEHCRKLGARRSILNYFVCFVILPSVGGALC